MEIKEFLLKGGSIKYPYKACLLSNYGNISIAVIDIIDEGKKVVMEIPGYEITSIDNINECIEKFLSVAMSRDNIHHVQEELMKKFDIDDIILDADFLGEEMKKLGYRENQFRFVDEE